MLKLIPKQSTSDCAEASQSKWFVGHCMQPFKVTHHATWQIRSPLRHDVVDPFNSDEWNTVARRHGIMACTLSNDHQPLRMVAASTLEAALAAIFIAEASSTASMVDIGARSWSSLVAVSITMFETPGERRCWRLFRRGYRNNR